MSSHKIKDIFTEGAISPAFIMDSIQKHSVKTDIGAHNIFLGQIRADIKEGRQVIAIHYTAYEQMALEKMATIREDIFAKYSLTCLHVHHSLGQVAVGEICLFVFTSAAHRKEAINACEALVERIKEELPIWGEEIFDNGSQTWKINR